MEGKDHEVWVITGVSKLSGERVTISRPMTREQANRMLTRVKSKFGTTMKNSYTRLRVELGWPKQLNIDFYAK